MRSTNIRSAPLPAGAAATGSSLAWKKSPAAVLAALLVLHVLAHIDRNILIGFSPQVTQELALGNAQYGFLVGGAWVLSFGVMALFMGSLADRFSRTRVIAAGLLVWSACTAASGCARSFEQLVAARLLVASGEAALVPAAVALLAELFAERKRGAAIGIFFVGIPLGVGLSFLLAGSLGATHGWRNTFLALGAAGAVLALPLALLTEERGATRDQPRGAPFAIQLRTVFAVLRSQPRLRLVMAAFVLANLLFATLSFAQLWLVRERGMETAGIARTIGLLQIAFGTLGAVGGGWLGDRFARRHASGHAGFMALLVAVCAPLMIAYRLAPAGTPLFYTGMCAGVFLPLALYGPSNALIQGLVPPQLRATVAGCNMLLINLFAIAGGNLAIGWASDRLARAGTAAPLTTVLLATDLLALACGPLFWRIARAARREAVGLQPLAAGTP